MTDDVLKNRLELHYYFNNDDVHTMDAVIRNKCENEILHILTTISKELNINIKAETEAYKEGGLIELWSFFCSVDGQQLINISNFIVGFTDLLVSNFPKKKSKLTNL